MKVIAGMIVGYSIMGNIFATIGMLWFTDATTAVERSQARWEYLILLALGCILWQLVNMTTTNKITKKGC